MTVLNIDIVLMVNEMRVIHALDECVCEIFAVL